jgi:hypothetical protein
MKPKIEDMEDVVAFYQAAVYEHRIIMHPDYGFLQDDGSPAFPHKFDRQKHMELQQLHMDAIRVATKYMVDVHDVIMFSEAVRVVHDCDIEWSPDNFDGIERQPFESPEQIAERRARIQYRYMELVLEKTCDGVVKDPTGGIALPAHNMPPAVRDYVNRVTERMGDMIVEKNELGSASGIEERLKANIEQLHNPQPVDDIDPDSDDNDDDPFANFDFGEEE